MSLAFRRKATALPEDNGVPLAEVTANTATVTVPIMLRLDGRLAQDRTLLNRVVEAASKAAADAAATEVCGCEVEG